MFMLNPAPLNAFGNLAIHFLRISENVAKLPFTVSSACHLVLRGYLPYSPIFGLAVLFSVDENMIGVFLLRH